MLYPTYATPPINFSAGETRIIRSPSIGMRARRYILGSGWGYAAGLIKMRFSTRPGCVDAAISASAPPRLLPTMLTFCAPMQSTTRHTAAASMRRLSPPRCHPRPPKEL